MRERCSKGRREAGPGVSGDGGVREGRRLLALLYLLAGDPASAVALVPKGEPRGWSNGEHFDPAGDLDGPPSEDAAETAAKSLALTSALRAGMAAHAGATRARLLERGAALARARVEAIVSNKNRGAYERAARLWSGVHDAYVLAGLANEGARLFAELRDRFSRSYRFRERLDEAARCSAAALARRRLPHPESG